MVMRQNVDKYSVKAAMETRGSHNYKQSMEYSTDLKISKQAYKRKDIGHLSMKLHVNVSTKQSKEDTTYIQVQICP